MKLRLRGNTLRLRLTRGEVEAIARGLRVEEVVEFGPGERLVYALELRDDAEFVAARFREGTITVVLPGPVARAWAGGDEVGVSATQPLEGGRVLALLVEKDFACLKPREGEDDEDAFPHPQDPSGKKRGSA